MGGDVNITKTHLLWAPKDGARCGGCAGWQRGRISCPYAQHCCLPRSQSVSIKIGDISGKQTAKGKPFMRVLHTGGDPVVFQFESAEQRDRAVELLTSLAAALPQGERAASAAGAGPGPGSHAQSEAKVRVLQKHPE